MGNVLLARILEYFNGTLFLDDNYRFCVFFIENYIDFYKMTLEEVVEKSKISKEAILNFLSHLGFDDYASFQDKLYADVILRQDQIRSRMLGLKMDDLFKQVHLCDDKEKFIEDQNILATDFSIVLEGDMLRKTDLMGMANSTEIRSPFLDYELVDNVFKIPNSFKVVERKLT